MDERAAGSRALRTRSFRAAVLALLVLVSSAVYAPFLANDRPYLLEAVDYGACAAARRELVAITREVVRLDAERRGPDAAERRDPDAAKRRDIGAADVSRRLDREAAAARARIATLVRYLPAAERELPERYLAALGDAVAGRGGSAELTELVERIATELRARDPRDSRDDAPGDSRGVELVARTSFPVLSALGSIDVLAIVAWTLALPCLAGLVRARGRAPVRCLLLALVAGACAGVAWQALRGGAAFEPARFKEGLARGDIVARRAWFPPVAMGFAETNLAEALRPPTWLASSELDASGRYVRGPRAGSADPASGFAPAAVPVEVRPGEPALNSPWRHPLGTDAAGRDLLARLLWGGRASLVVGFLAAVLLTIAGTVLGAVAGYAGGWIDHAISRTTEVVMAFPAFFLVLLMAAFADPDALPPVLGIALVIALVGWTGVARLARAELLRLREQEFVLAARGLGFSHARVLARHVLPNALGPILVAFAFAAAGGIVVESTISFLGFGIDRPTPSWGSLIAESRSAAHGWIQVFPGLAILATVLATHVVGERVRDALDPRATEGAA